jgi:predicted RNase H-like nuclease (RuvC/YqgF family)
LISKYTADLGERDNVIKELKEQVENAVDLSELESAKAEIEQLHVKIQACDPKIYENTIDELKLQLECKNKVIEHLTSQFNRMKNSAIVTELKPINEPTELFNKSIEPKRSTTFSIPFPPKKQLNTTENSNFKYNDENR